MTKSERMIERHKMKISKTIKKTNIIQQFKERVKYEKFSSSS
jgi:hypothetical protein